MLEDIALLTGGQVVSIDAGLSLEKMEVQTFSEFINESKFSFLSLRFA